MNIITFLQKGTKYIYGTLELDCQASVYWKGKNARENFNTENWKYFDESQPEGFCNGEKGKKWLL